MKAFPLSSPRDLSRPADNKVNPLERGMDLRDYFAARAMQGIISTVPHLKTINVNDCAEEAYLYADAMMLIREGLPSEASPKVADEVLNAVEAQIEEAPAKPAKKVSKKND